MLRPAFRLRTTPAGLRVFAKLSGLARDAVVVAVQMWRVRRISPWKIVSAVGLGEILVQGRRLRPAQRPHLRRSHRKPPRRRRRLTCPAYAYSPACQMDWMFRCPVADS